MVNLQKENISLILDPTNPGIGVVYKGKIYMFSTADGKSIEARPLGNFILYGLNETIDFINASLGSNIDEKKFEELKTEYGPDALNRDLEIIKSLENDKKNDKKIVPQALIDEESAIKTADLREPKQKQSERID